MGVRMVSKFGAESTQCGGKHPIENRRIAYDTAQRLRNIRYSYPANVELLWEQEVGKIARSVEAAAHRTLADRRIIGEWFRVSLDEAVLAVECAISQLANRPVRPDPRPQPPPALVWIDGRVSRGFRKSA